MSKKYDDAVANDATVLDAAVENVSSVDADNTGTRSCSVRKRVAIAAGSVAILAIGGCTAWATGLFNTEDTEPVQVTVTGSDDDINDEDVIVDGVATVSLVPIADGFNDNSSPFIARIAGETAAGETVDFYHAVWADGSTSEIELEQGEYEITWISAVNSDGSIYSTTEIVTTFAVSADDVEADGAESETTDDNKNTDGNKDASESIAVAETLEVEQVFELIDPSDVTEEDIEAILAEIEEAIANGDEALTSTNGSTIVEIIEENISTVDDTVDEVTSDVATEETSSSSSTSSTSSNENSSSSSSDSSASSSSSKSNSNTNSSSSNNNKSNSNSSSSSGSPSSSSSSSGSNNNSSSSSSLSSSNESTSGSSSRNNSANSSNSSSNSSNSSSSTHSHSWTLASGYYECKGCGTQFDSSSESELRAHIKEGAINRTTCTSYSTKHNYTCSCGATKQDW